jgi:SAM-dependent methyltransferase
MAIDTAAFRQFEHEGWQRAAAHYAEAFGGVTREATAPLLDAAGVHSGTRVLDVATGPGFVAAAAAARGAVVKGLDFSRAMLAEARRANPGLEFMEGDAEHLPFDDRSFDAAVMNFGMLHLPAPDAAMREAFRVLQNGGGFAFTVWAAPEQAVGFGIVLRAVQSHGRVDVPLPEGPPFHQFSDPAECTRALESAGFRDVHVRMLPIVWKPDSPDAVFDAVSRGGVRTAALLRAQSAAALQTIRKTVVGEVERYRSDDGDIVLPMPAVLASAVRPQAAL